ncbi:MAG: ACP S-malonyltransferase [bacterium]
MKIAAVFPGQGSQSLGMLKELAEKYPLVEEVFAEASEVLGYDLWDLAQNGPEEELNKTEKTQPAMLAAGVAVWRVWELAGGAKPAAMAGHSLGEYTALVCSGALPFKDAVALVAERGRQMQEAVPAGEGAMAAILGLDDATVAQVCDDASQGQVASPVNFNSPGQVVIAGHADAIDRAVVLAKDAGAKRALKLSVSVPSHCELMLPAAEAMRARFDDVEVSSPEVPVFHNVDVRPHESADEIRDALAAQLHQPVRWVETVQALADAGIEVLVEMGPGKVLAGLTRRIDKSLQGVCVMDSQSLVKATGLASGES